MSYKENMVQRSKLIPDILVIRPSVNWDLRGNIFSSFNEEFYKEISSEPLDFIHDKFAYSKNHVLRGLHGDTKTWKLVSCVYGKLFEVVVDMRPESASYKKWDAFVLDAADYSQVLIPPRFVNGYYVMSKEAVFHYKLAYNGNYIDADEQMTIAWNDPELGIDWPCVDPILQARDMIREKE